MTALHVTNETSAAYITRTSPVLIETYFKEDVPITPAGIFENIAARRRMCEGKPHVMLSVIKGERYLDPAVMRTDFFNLPQDREVVQAIALVLDGVFLPAVAQMYFAYFPQTFRTEVFGNEEDAREWLARESEGLN